MSSGDPKTRARILRAVVALLADKPGVAIRMADIAKRAGISRQALYLHFSTRTDLLIAAMRFNDDTLQIDARLAGFRGASSGEEKLTAFVRFWAGHVDLIYPMARALLALRDSDSDARAAWEERMAAVRDGCARVIRLLAEEGRLAEPWTEETGTEAFAALLSIQNWAFLVRERGWSLAEYAERIGAQARRSFVAPGR